ncbi:cdc42 effector protein 4a [Electrophorus electricus]|uniref:CRIB domain-containing protein n=1 Tax=Electrophorus electricus TaxID=8005 RepID=A0AAY5ETU7_ELEEL|nr:cdc42 effector protein 4a [Electrophorus electricus]XP_035388261.1 cdc42 effector protein 4a [Electrophorus electricus]
MPILKQLVPSSASQTKRRSRMDLTTEMISAPLGDFRHTMHVGRSGDAFGDTSFLSSRTGEPSPDAHPRSPKPGLLSRTFRSSKRSQSVTRVDQREHTLLPPRGSPTFVKNALSLPFLNEGEGDAAASRAHKSLAGSPLRQQASNGAAAHQLDLELHERCFGELTDLRPLPSWNGGGMKHAESVMSFHVDLGPSMLGDILGVMEKEEEDLGFEEGKNSEGQASPLPSDQGGEEEEDAMKEEQEEMVVEQQEEEAELEAEQMAPNHAPGSVEMEMEMQSESAAAADPQPRELQQADSCSVSSSGSHALEDKPTGQPYGADADSAGHSYRPGEEGAFSSFLEDEDDEIRV